MSDDGQVHNLDDDLDDTGEAAYQDTVETEPPGRPTRAAPDPSVPHRRRTDHELRATYRALRKQFLARCAAEQTPCFFNDGAINYQLPHTDSRAATIHHTIPVALRPDLELETSIWAIAHSLCNKLNCAAFAGEAETPDWDPELGSPSEIW